MCPFPWVTRDGRTWRAQDSGPGVRDQSGSRWSRVDPAHARAHLARHPSLELAKEVAALAAGVLDDDRRRTSIYRVVTVYGAHYGDEFGAYCDEDTLAMIRLRRHAGALPWHVQAVTVTPPVGTAGWLEGEACGRFSSRRLLHHRRPLRHVGRTSALGALPGTLRVPDRGKRRTVEEYLRVWTWLVTSLQADGDAP